MTAPSNDLTPFLAPIFSRKPRSVTAIDVGAYTSYADTLVIVEAGSHRQVTSLAEHIVTRLKAGNIQALGTEGIKEGEWALLDYGSLIIHVFETRAKGFYDLEGLWNDAPRLDLSGFETLAQKPGKSS
jgi:ribosome-associated protein